MALGTLGIYGCGGFGINSARIWDKTISANVDTALHNGKYADITVSYVDTSRTENLVGDEPPEHVYVVEGLGGEAMDGAGKIRRASHEAFSNDNAVNQILLQCPPKALNIVMFSLSGGTGNTIGTELMLEMLSRDVSVIGIVVASSESSITLQNTMDAIKTLDTKARKNGTFFTVCFDDNANNTERSEVDERVRSYVGAVAKLAAPGVRELGTADVSNWLHPDRIRGVNVKPQLALLDIVTDVENLKGIADPLSVASLITDPSETLGDVMPEYTTVGYHEDTSVSNTSYHFAISIDAVPVIANKLKAKLEELAKRRAARKVQPSVADPDDVEDEDGFYL